MDVIKYQYEHLRKLKREIKDIKYISLREHIIEKYDNFGWSDGQEQMYNDYYRAMAIDSYIIKKRSISKNIKRIKLLIQISERAYNTICYKFLINNTMFSRLPREIKEIMFSYC